jgi:putative transposase
LALPPDPNQRWSPGFLSDAFAHGGRFRILAIVDVFTREYLALVADTSLPSLRVARELGAVIIRRGRSAIIVSNRVEASPHGHMPALWPRSIRG